LKALFDNNIAPRIARAINVIVELYDDEAIALRDKFPTNISDIDLIQALDKEGGWVLVSEDRRITKNRAEREALRQASVVGFFLMPAWRKLDTRQKTAALLYAWPKMQKQFSLVQPGSAFQLPVNRNSKLKSMPL
jgi:hypothetical protein